MSGKKEGDELPQKKRVSIVESSNEEKHSGSSSSADTKAACMDNFYLIQFV